MKIQTTYYSTAILNWTSMNVILHGAWKQVSFYNVFNIALGHVKTFYQGLQLNLVCKGHRIYSVFSNNNITNYNY